MRGVEKIRAEVERLGMAAGGEAWCPGGGWQFPFEFGNGVVARTYTPLQAAIHPWRRDVMLRELDREFMGRYGEISVLDLGSGEGAMALALWQRGVRDITCVEVRRSNVEKARFVSDHFQANLNVIECGVQEFLSGAERGYDLVLFMGLLYHLLDPFTVMRRIGEVTKELLFVETVIAVPEPVRFANVPDYSPTQAGFFVRRDCAESHTAGTHDLELWPTREALDMLLESGGFAEFQEAVHGEDTPAQYLSGERVLGLARKRSGG